MDSKSEMKPCALRISARLAFMRDAGISTNLCRACTALRMRVRKSAIGSVMVVEIANQSWSPRRGAIQNEARLPACFADAWDLSLERERSELIATEPELAEIGRASCRERV